MQPKEHDHHGIAHSARLVEEEQRRLLAPLGIHPRQARVLMAMKHMAPVSQTELAAAVGISPAGMSTMTDRLLAAGFITRRQDPALRRRNVLELTPQGLAKLDAISAVWCAVDDRIRDALGAEDAETLFRLARRLRRALGGEPPGTPAEPSGEA
ncbi:MarR family winged helix-turn-helix transcriptional regulator [Tropicimonas sp. TH_r6]|uniref:MarR family winged helix-turn-helix transcriptional regulator n=1 Tax=Tropicimonas sp. TH_r6 TaxID=3082085 RepID=UPI002953EA3A|nr:MarR family winged helix-turn-helix transcriptional regulator [Tropicimonas sp. TH_r6]MDV7145337.1 MarR family winged helix-turn-helix transcriptional regulator [Tropicimonas sp. TH_r6]